MSNKSIRIPTTPGGTDKYVTLKLENDIDFFEILSLKISQKDLYATFNADYGVIVGRVIANGGIGIPNAKISVFIPISEEDRSNPEISSIYPYTSPRDKNIDGVKYNLLPRVAVNNPFLVTGSYAPAVPVGTFPTKEEITTNSTYLEVYEKYYKFTTVTNQAGDYMIFGAPVGIQTVHMSVDITDIGQYSMTPATMVSQLGYSPQLFSNNKIKFTTDLDNLPNVDIQNISVDVKPFWGDSENYEIGITRQDFKIRATLVTSVTVFGAGFTDGFDAVWGLDSFFGNRDDSATAMSINRSMEADGSTRNEGVKFNTGIASRRNAPFKIEVYTIPNTISEAQVNSGNFDTQTDIIKLESTQYSEILEDGLFLITLPCNRNKKVVDEFGNLVPTTEDDPNGIFTEFYGMFIIDYGPETTMFNNPVNKPRDQRERSDRGRLKIPQTAPLDQTFTSERGGEPGPTYNERWRKQVFKFTGGKLYSVAKYNPVSFETLAIGQDLNNIGNNIWRNVGNLASLSVEDDDIGFAYNATATYAKIGNGGDETLSNRPVFGAEWLNFCLYFPQIYNYTSGVFDVTRLLSSDFGSGTDMTIRNPYRVVGFRTDTSYFLRSDYHKSTFIEVPIADLVSIIQNVPNKKGFTSADPGFSGAPLTGNYPGNGSTKYFFKGLKEADVIAFLQENGVIAA